MASNKKYWKNEIELQEGNPLVDQIRQNEFPEEIPTSDFLQQEETLAESSTSRRDLLKYVGFSTAAASLAACEGPVEESIPYVVQPDRIVPGVANFYATTIADGFDFASVLVKTREGRPIFIKPNDRASVLSHGNARVNASVLSLYDKNRIQGPINKAGEQIDWSALDAAVKAKLDAMQGGSKQAVILTQSYASPSMKRLVADFAAAYPFVKHVVYDAISEDAALSAFDKKYGERALADYDFEKAELIVSFAADFLGDWQGGGYDGGYAKGRIPKNGKMSRHIQVESNMSLSGANADTRIPLQNAKIKIALAKLYYKLNGSTVGGGEDSAIDAYVDAITEEIRQKGSKAVVVCGIQDEDAQLVTLAINELIQSEAFDATAPRYIREGNVNDLNRLMADMKTGQVGMLITDGINPVYSLPNGQEFKDLVSQVDLSVSFSFLRDETAESTTYTAARSHYLESWGDVELKKGHYSLMQPVIRKLFSTRQLQDCLLSWMGSDQNYYDYIKANWGETVLQGGSWNQALQDGVFHAGANAEGLVSEVAAAIASVGEETTPGVSALTVSLRSLMNSASPAMELVLYSKSGMGDGQQANNPWLQEFPDPISRASWDNYITVSKADAERMELVNENVANGGLNGSYVTVKVGGVSLPNVPVMIQPGQAPGTVGLALGYGRKSGIQSEMQTGVNAFPLYTAFDNVQEVSLTKESGMHEFACIQLHKTLMGRGDIIKETTLDEFNTEDAAVWNPIPQVSLDHQEVAATSVDLWESFDRSIGHHFNMSIDLNACTGCGACVIACHSENNVPVVGKQEIRKSRDMHWLRIDRYYSSADTFAGDDEYKDEISGLLGEDGSLKGFGKMEDPSANPQVAFQPVMCQHCNHAPCETVCPVAATAHSRQGHNHMAYNRCVGTRYCANNCPYKVRRFNWFLYNNNDEFDYHMNNDLGKMVLNPDVNVRSRGVMEKCSWCIQMTQKSILDAKRDGREVKDEEFQTACSAACGTGAIVFGDINDEHSEVSKLKKDDRMYHLLEHVGTQPNVFYQVKVRNTEEA